MNMRPKNQKHLLIMLFLVFPLILPNLSFPAEAAQKRIGKKDLFLKFKKGETLRGVVIQGPDLIEIMKMTDNDIRIEGATIEGGLDFSSLPTVKNQIEIIDSEIRTNPDSFSVKAESTHFSKAISFSRTVFRGTASFSSAIFNKEAAFNQAVFNGKVVFNQAVFKEKPVFTAITFHGLADFSWVVFDEEAVFDLASFEDRTNFEAAAFHEKVSFRLVSFKGRTNFGAAIFKKEVSFISASFELEAFFQRAVFNETAVFVFTTFGGHADFTRTTFHKLTSFLRAVFKNRLILGMVDIRQYADFRDTVIGELDFNSAKSPAVVAGRIDFRRAIISDAHFQDIIFEKDVDFSDAIFVKTVFRDLIFEENAYFLRTKFRLHTAIENVRFKQDADFREARLESNQKFLMSYVLFNSLKLKWRQLPGLSAWMNDSEDSVKSFLDAKREQEALNGQEEERVKIGGVEGLSEAVLGLEAVFRRHSQLKDANAAYYHIKTLDLKKARKAKSFWEWFSEQPLWIGWWATTGFGMQLPWILAWCFGVNLFFTLLYCLRGNLKDSPKADDTFKVRILDFPKRYFTEALPEHRGCGIKQFFSIFWFSAVVLMKVGYRNKVIEGKAAGIHYKWIVRLEWLVGLYFLAALSFTLQNVVPVVNKLVTGVF